MAEAVDGMNRLFPLKIHVLYRIVVCRYVYKAQAYSLLWCDWCSQDLETPAGKKLEAVWRWWMTRAACERDRGWPSFSHSLSLHYLLPYIVTRDHLRQIHMLKG